jgi:hypothetical protein
VDGGVEPVRVLLVEQGFELGREEVEDRLVGVEEAIDGHDRADAWFEGRGSWGQVAAEGHADEPQP